MPIHLDCSLSDVLVWRQSELAYRDRALVAFGELAAGGKLVEMRAGLRRSVESGITLDELRGLAAGKAERELLEVEDKQAIIWINPGDVRLAKRGE